MPEAAMHPNHPAPHRARRAHRALAAATLLGAAASLALAAPAEAQLLKRVKQAAQERLAGAVVEQGAEKAGVAPAAAPAAAPAGAATAAPGAKRSKSELEITPERLDAFLVAMKPMAADAQRKRAEAARQAEYKARQEKWQSCAQRVQAQIQVSRTMPTPAGTEASREPLERQTALMERASKLYATDPMRAALVQDSSSGAMYDATVAMFPAFKSCGSYVYMPAPLPGTPAPGAPAAKPALPAGMSATQFGIMRERIAAFVLTNGTEGKVSDGERTALDAKRAELAPLAALFKDGTLAWESWGDLTGEW